MHLFGLDAYHPNVAEPTCVLHYIFKKIVKFHLWEHYHCGSITVVASSRATEYGIKFSPTPQCRSSRKVPCCDISAALARIPQFETQLSDSCQGPRLVPLRTLVHRACKPTCTNSPCLYLLCLYRLESSCFRTTVLDSLQFYSVFCSAKISCASAR